MTLDTKAILEELEKISPIDWEWQDLRELPPRYEDEDDDAEFCIYSNTHTDLPGRAVCDILYQEVDGRDITMDRANFIAKAPERLAEACREIEGLREENTFWRVDRNIRPGQKQIQDLEAKLAIAIEALEICKNGLVVAFSDKPDWHRAFMEHIKHRTNVAQEALEKIRNK